MNRKRMKPTRKNIVLGVALCSLLINPPLPAIELPDFGDSSGAVISPRQEHRLGEGLLREIRAQGKLVNDPEVEAYIQALGSRLASASEDNAEGFTFFVVDDSAINAFAAPGGFVGMHSGLILMAQNESELAGVLAHEIAHVTQKHLARAFEQASQLSIPMAAAMLGAILLGAQNPDMAQAAITAVAAGRTQLQLDFTRGNEEEADRIGMHTLTRSGFDPQGMPSFFERLQRSNRYTDTGLLPEFLRTHPVTVSRIAESRERAEKYPRAPAKNSRDFYLIQTKLQVAALGDPAKARQYFDNQLRRREYVSEDVARYGYVLALIETGEFGRARPEVERLLKADGAAEAYLLAAGRLNMKDNHDQEALQTYAKALSHHPGSRPVLLAHAEALLHAGKPHEAKKMLGDYAGRHAPDIAYYTLLAEAEGKLGSQVEAQLALAERYYLAGETALAREQLKFAQRASGVDHYQRQRIEARLKDFEKVLCEELEEESGSGPRLPSILRNSELDCTPYEKND
jgi:predicted Zn-dependent protease